MVKYVSIGYLLVVSCLMNVHTSVSDDVISITSMTEHISGQYLKSMFGAEKKAELIQKSDSESTNL